MTIDEAITHCLEVADGQTEQGKCSECAMEHRQLAEWLKELKAYKEQGGDAVSRQAAKELYFKDGYIDFRKICELPSVNPQRMGHWTYLFNSTVNGLKVCECDACKKRAYGSTHFCPNCGAKMVESQAESEGSYAYSD